MESEEFTAAWSYRCGTAAQSYWFTRPKSLGFALALAIPGRRSGTEMVLLSTCCGQPYAHPLRRFRACSGCGDPPEADLWRLMAADPHAYLSSRGGARYTHKSFLAARGLREWLLPALEATDGPLEAELVWADLHRQLCSWAERADRLLSQELEWSAPEWDGLWTADSSVALPGAVV